MTSAKKTEMRATVLKKTFGLTLLNQDVFFEGIISPIFCIGTEIQKKKLLEKLLSFKESNSNV